MAALMVFAGPALAYYPPQGGASADVDCDEPGVDNEDPTVGDTVLFFGTVHYDISAYNNKNYYDDYGGYYGGCKYDSGAYVILNASGYYVVLDPESNTVAEDGFDWSTGYVMGDTGNTGWPCYWPADENVSYSINEPWSWSVPVTLDMAGDYTVENGGDASAEYGHWVQWYKWVPGCWGGTWVPNGDPQFYAEGDPAYDSCTAATTVTARSALVAAASQSHPYLVINLPDGSRHFYSNDGWGDPTTQGIAYTDGIWQVEISNGTAIQMDGSWHRTTYLDVDDQGNVTGRYDAGGSTVAEEIGLSQPITITKVG